MGKQEEKRKQAEERALRDVEAFMADITETLKHYRNLVDRLEAIKDDRKKDAEKLDMMLQRDELKERYIRKKQAARTLFELCAPSMGVMKEREMKALQEDFRDMDGEYKSLGISVNKDLLLAGATVAQAPSVQPGHNTNAELLQAAADRQAQTTEQLKEALGTVVSSQAVGADTLITLSEDREKIERIDKGLDEADSELSISKKLITRFFKRLYTDKIIIAFAFLVLMGIVGIIVYATVNPNQTTFDVPDVVKPPITTPSS